MRIAILDPCIHSPGLKTIFPESDYYIVKYNNKYNWDITPSIFYTQYQFNYNEEYSNIKSDNYDILIIIYCIRDFNYIHKWEYIETHKRVINDIVSKNKFKKLIFIDNDDYNDDPSINFSYINPDIWLKRYYSSKITYGGNVKPCPFVIFGVICPLWKVLSLNYTIPLENRIDRILWAGNKSAQNPSTLDYLSRGYIIDRLHEYLTIISVPNSTYLEELSKSKFALDLNGVGDPNIRTYEILCTNALLIQQYKHLVWPFNNNDAFSEETIFKTPEEFIRKINILRNDINLYNKCLNNQIYIKNKYINKYWLRNYIL